METTEKKNTGPVTEPEVSKTSGLLVILTFSFVSSVQRFADKFSMPERWSALGSYTYFEHK